MQFHQYGYVSGDPRIQIALKIGEERPQEIPDTVDVLIVGTGPAGMIAAAQLSQFPNVTTRIVEQRAGGMRSAKLTESSRAASKRFMLSGSLNK